jgi:hypothetical protein
MDGRGVVLGYFFRPRRDARPAMDQVGELRAADAVEVALFGDLGLIEGRWTVIGSLPGWEPEKWPIPDFGRIDAVSGKRAWRARYRDPDLKLLSDEEIDVCEARTLPKDGLMGVGAVERWLSHLLEQDRPTSASPRSMTTTRA